MSVYKIFSLILSGFESLAAAGSVIQNRRFNRKLVEQQSVTANLAKRQLADLEENAPLEGQPTFLLRTKSIRGIGDLNTPDYRVKIHFEVSLASGKCSSLEHLVLVTPQAGVYKSSIISGVYLEYGHHILGKQVIVAKHDSALHECKIHIVYTDSAGTERIQEFKIVAEGPKGPLPFRVSYELQKVMTIRPNFSALWLKPS